LTSLNIASEIISTAKTIRYHGAMVPYVAWKVINLQDWCTVSVYQAWKKPYQ
jgi:hypothetical protein